MTFIFTAVPAEEKQDARSAPSRPTEAGEITHRIKT